jgi:hypothetical protein
MKGITLWRARGTASSSRATEDRTGLRRSRGCRDHLPGQGPARRLCSFSAIAARAVSRSRHGRATASCCKCAGWSGARGGDGSATALEPPTGRRGQPNDILQCRRPGAATPSAGRCVGREALSGRRLHKDVRLDLRHVGPSRPSWHELPLQGAVLLIILDLPTGRSSHSSLSVQ